MNGNIGLISTKVDAKIDLILDAYIGFISTKYDADSSINYTRLDTDIGLYIVQQIGRRY